MDLQKLFQLQKQLDDHIEEQHPRKNGIRLNKKTIAFLVELSEMLNEKRSVFKFWSNKKDNNQKALEEYVDGLHFLLSIGLEINFILDPEPNVLDYEDIEVQILEVYHSASQITEFSYNSYERAFELYLGLGELLGFTWAEIEQAYISKNQTNHERQENGY